MIDNKKIEAIKKLNNELPNLKLTGSASLVLHGVTKREIGDLDFVIESMKDVELIAEDYSIDYSYNYDVKFEKEHLVVNDSFGGFAGIKLGTHKKVKIPNRAHFKMDGVNVCLFFGKNLKSRGFDIGDGYCMEVVDPVYSIEAKKEFIQNYWNIEKKKPLKQHQLKTIAKHFKDIMNYSEWLKIRWEEDQVSKAEELDDIFPF